MKNSITIEAPEGFEINLDKESGKFTFKAVPKLMQINSFEDICKIMGKATNDYICNSDDPDDIAANAYKQALLISRCLNSDKTEVVDWSNDNQRKYFHVYVYSPSSGWSLYYVDYWDTFTYCGSRLAFLDEDDAQFAWDKFSSIYINLIK